MSFTIKCFKVTPLDLSIHERTHDFIMTNYFGIDDKNFSLFRHIPTYKTVTYVILKIN